ncbi:WW domain-containing protein [Aspergillus homomorphus CBS 101889]|uniref:WW domain-containing protein n=1 Tax=Aspergillus homomorphus (strain CBS 101889) TaxID=1450537 RepID=A0A395HZF1_ASPHC|nr:hypothetical protein BO97DRAFT_405338 [Aspergillus homomorphus CBS 101889]RAL12763.1 hypothetical protein BO97DRAFT_405338 [Aspergillus homomorphus CBS 101889]
MSAAPQDVTGSGAVDAPESRTRDPIQEQVSSDVRTENTEEKEAEEVQAPQPGKDRGASEARQEEEKEEEEEEEEEDDGPDSNKEEMEEGETEADSDAESRSEQDDAKKEEEEDQPDTSASAPPLPDEVPPPLPNEVPPSEDDGWEPVWDANAQAYYFYNRLTGVSQWENPRVPDASPAAAAAEKPAPVAAGYNPAIHGDYDPTAPYAQQYERQEDAAAAAAMDPNQAYEAVGAFNRFTGRWQEASQNPEYHNDENKSRRQMYAFFDVDAAANSHDGRSLRAERSAKKLTKAELKAFKEKRREKKEEKRRAWLRD